MNRSLSTGVFAGTTYLGSNPERIIAKEILDGRKDPYTPEEVGRLVDQRYFGFEPLFQPEKQEESFLRNTIVNRLLNHFNEGDLRIFFGSACFQSANKSIDRYSHHVYANDSNERKRRRSYLRKMTNEEKLVFLEDPRNLNVRWHTTNSESNFAKMGYRHIDDYSLSSAKDFSTLIRRLQTAMGKKELHVLDLGGGVGLALNDINKLHPELVTYNATRDEEFSHYPTDFHIVGFMERLPLTLKGKIDFIFSNMTTRYLAYCDLVIQNCVLMLSKGGVMDIFFSSERSDNPSRDDVKRRMKKAHDFLKDLERLGLIKLKIKYSFSTNMGGSYKSNAGSLYPAASVFVKKL